MIVLGDVWWNDPGWWIAIVLGIFGSGIIALLIYRKQRNRKQISYQVLSDAPIVNIDRRVRDKIKIIYYDNGNQSMINDANLVSMKIWNSGDVDVKIWNKDDIDVEDLEVPISFKFEKRNIVSLSELKTGPQDGVINERDIATYVLKPLEHNSIGLPRCILKPNQSISLSLLLKGPKGRIIQEGKLFAGTVTEFNPNRQKKNRRMRFLFSKSILPFVILGICLIGLVFSFTLLDSMFNGNNPRVLKNVAEFNIDKNGNINFQPSSNVVIQGTLVENSKFYASLHVPGGVLFLIIRHSHNNSLLDTMYSITVGQSGGTIFTNFESQLVKQNVFLVDDTNDTVGTISVYGANNSLVANKLRITSITHI